MILSEEAKNEPIMNPNIELDEEPQPEVRLEIFAYESMGAAILSSRSHRFDKNGRPYRVIRPIFHRFE